MPIVASVLILAAAPTAAAGAPYEPNDATSAASGPLLAGQTYQAANESAGDRDFYFFYVTSAEPVQVWVTVQNLGGGAKASDLEASILDADATPVASQSFIHDGEARLVSAQLEPQKYYLEIAANEGYGDSYSLTTGGETGAFGSYEEISGRCASASSRARRLSRRLSRLRSKLQRTTARLRRSRYAPPRARRRARAAQHRAKHRVAVKRRALRAARRSTRPWCSIAP